MNARNWAFPIHAALEPSCVPRLTNEAIEAAARQTESDCVIDAITPGRPLIISFNDYTQRHEFDLFGRIRKLEERARAPFNRIFLRDSNDSWYQYGVRGLGDSVHAVAHALHRLIRYIQPSSVITIGQSMGAYAALLYGMLLHVDRAVGFGPLSHLDAVRTRADGDVRWLSLFEKFHAAPPVHWYPDLVALAQSMPILPEMHVIAGTHPHGNDNQPNMDALHTARFATVPGLSLYEYPEAGHDVALWLREQQLLDNFLFRLIAAPIPPAIRMQGNAAQTTQYTIAHCRSAY